MRDEVATERPSIKGSREQRRWKNIRVSGREIAVNLCNWKWNKLDCTSLTLPFYRRPTCNHCTKFFWAAYFSFAKNSLNKHPRWKAAADIQKTLIERDIVIHEPGNDKLARFFFFAVVYTWSDCLCSRRNIFWVFCFSLHSTKICILAFGSAYFAGIRQPDHLYFSLRFLFPSAELPFVGFSFFGYHIIEWCEGNQKNVVLLSKPYHIRMFNSCLHSGWRCTKWEKRRRNVKIFLGQFNFSYICVLRTLKITNRRNGRQTQKNWSFEFVLRASLLFPLPLDVRNAHGSTWTRENTARKREIRMNLPEKKKKNPPQECSICCTAVIRASRWFFSILLVLRFVFHQKRKIPSLLCTKNRLVSCSFLRFDEYFASRRYLQRIISIWITQIGKCTAQPEDRRRKKNNMEKQLSRTHFYLPFLVAATPFKYYDIDCAREYVRIYSVNGAMNLLRGAIFHFRN